MTASLSSFYTSEWDDDQLFEMKHKRILPCSKSFNNGALKMGLPDSANEKANWNEFLIHSSKKRSHCDSWGRVTNVHTYTREPKAYFLSNEVISLSWRWGMLKRSKKCPFLASTFTTAITWPSSSGTKLTIFCWYRTDHLPAITLLSRSAIGLEPCNQPGGPHTDADQWPWDAQTLLFLLMMMMVMMMIMMMVMMMMMMMTLLTSDHGMPQSAQFFSFTLFLFLFFEVLHLHSRPALY